MDLGMDMNGTMCMLPAMSMPGMEVDTSLCANMSRRRFYTSFSLSLPADVLSLQQLWAIAVLHMDDH